MATTTGPSLNGFPFPWVSSHFGYAQRLVEGFNYVLSPQNLPQNMSARNQMDEELWMPVGYLIQLPALDRLFLTALSVPYITELLRRYAGDTLEVDVARQMIRPKWALRSSVFISSVDLNATPEQIWALLDDLRGGAIHPDSPFELHNIGIIKQSPSSWSLCFKSPSAGPYAAMSLKTKCINGRMTLPMACVHINPPRASYTSVGIAVMEIDALVSGDPIMPLALVPYYSESPEHLVKMYNTAMPQFVALGYETFFQGAGMVKCESIKSAHTTPSQLSAESECWYPHGCQAESGTEASGTSCFENVALAATPSDERRNRNGHQGPETAVPNIITGAEETKAVKLLQGGTARFQALANAGKSSQVQRDRDATSETSTPPVSDGSINSTSEEGMTYEPLSRLAVPREKKEVKGEENVSRICSGEVDWDAEEDSTDLQLPVCIATPSVASDTYLNKLIGGTTSGSPGPEPHTFNESSSSEARSPSMTTRTNSTPGVATYRYGTHHARQFVRAISAHRGTGPGQQKGLHGAGSHHRRDASRRGPTNRVNHAYSGDGPNNGGRRTPPRKYRSRDSRTVHSGTRLQPSQQEAQKKSPNSSNAEDRDWQLISYKKRRNRN